MKTDVVFADPSDPSYIERIAEKYKIEGYYLFAEDGHRLEPKTLFETIRRKGNTVIMIPIPKPN